MHQLLNGKKSLKIFHSRGCMRKLKSRFINFANFIVIYCQLCKKSEKSIKFEPAHSQLVILIFFFGICVAISLATLRWIGSCKIIHHSIWEFYMNVMSIYRVSSAMTTHDFFATLYFIVNEKSRRSQRRWFL